MKQVGQDEAKGGEERDERSQGVLLAPTPRKVTGGREVGPLDELIGPPPDNHLGAAQRENVVTTAVSMNDFFPAMTGVHEFHNQASSETKLSLAGLCFSKLGGHIMNLLQPLLWERPSKTLTMAKDPIYPMPLEGFHDVPPEMKAWLQAILMALNSLHGSGPSRLEKPTEIQKRVVSGLLEFLGRCWNWTEEIPHTSFSELFEVKGVDYRGEEVKLARSFNWACISIFHQRLALSNWKNFVKVVASSTLKTLRNFSNRKICKFWGGLHE